MAVCPIALGPPRQLLGWEALLSLHLAEGARIMEVEKAVARLAAYIPKVTSDLEVAF